VNHGVVLVTGGSRGIGAAIAQQVAAAGPAVCLTYRDDQAAAASVVAGIEAAGGTAAAVRADVAVEADILAAFAAADAMGSVTALVANAAIGATQARVDEVTAERVQRILAVNVLGPILCCREAVRRLSTRHGGPGGSIVLISSAASRLGAPGEYVDYAASKGAVDTLGLGLAREVAGEGIRVNVVRPGIIETDFHARGGQPDRAARLGPGVPIGRAGRAGEIAAAVRWLLSDEASYCTGSVLDVAGGR
jgi:NAD(P)-dependent dehydrogenase (short-subunit alcohol dehydrogenase family)